VLLYLSLSPATLRDYRTRFTWKPSSKIACLLWGRAADQRALQSAANQASQGSAASPANQRTFARSNSTLIAMVIIILMAMVIIIMIIVMVSPA
jgi:hypothetical protein